MATTMTFAKVRQYLDAIADNPDNVLSITGSPHARFWNVPYVNFINGTVPGGNRTACNNAPTPVIDHLNAANSSFFLILTVPAGFCGMPQMPEGGPFITDSGYQVVLADETTASGAQIQKDLLDWLSNGFPES